MRAYERLLNYVKVWTTSDEESTTSPTTARQFDLAKLLLEERKWMGIEDAMMDEYGYVYGHIPATPGYEKMCIRDRLNASHGSSRVDLI